MDKQWFYRDAEGIQQGPVSVEDLRSMLASGRLGRDDLAWSQGMPDWKRIDEIPVITAPVAEAGAEPPAEAAAELPAGASAALPATERATSPAARAGAVEKIGLPPGLLGWMTFVGIVTIIGGVLGVLSCIGIPTGVLTIVAGAGLLGAKTALESVREVDASLATFFNKLKLFVMMQGVVYIIGFALTVLLVVFYFSVIMAAIAGSNGEW
jgi:hypothetical protein